MTSDFTVHMDEYLPLREVVFNTLRQAILKGELKPGERLMEIALAEKLGVSRTPVREALRQLELEGLVKIVPNKGAYVTGITGKDVKDIYLVRSLLEGLCARWATGHITEKQIEKLEEIVLLSEFHANKNQKEKTGQVVELDGKFHEVLYEASNSRILEHVLSDFHKYVQMARQASVTREHRAEKSIKEHKEILEAIKQKDADKAEQLANEHILKVMQNLNIEA